MKTAPYSTLVVVGGLIVFACLALAAVLLIAPGPESSQRLALFFGVIGSTVAALVAALRADQSQKQTNGTLDQRIEDGVHRALAGRRSTDRVESPTVGGHDYPEG